MIRNKKVTRRKFIRTTCALSFELAVSPTLLRKAWADIIKRGELGLKLAKYYRELSGHGVQCLLCPHKCILYNGQRGICKVRENREGQLYSLVYGNPCVIHRDPVEKSPLFHFLPGAQALALATAGCNLSCLYCINWQISQSPPEETTNFLLSPREAVQMALKYSCRCIVYTYSEPVVFYEYMLDTAEIAKQKGLRNIVVTSAYISPGPLKELCKYADAFKVDLKGFDEAFYREICGGDLKHVLKALEVLKDQDTWIELVYLVLPHLNDSEKRIKIACQWVKENLGDEIPIAFNKFQQSYKLRTLPPTPEKTLEKAKKIASEIGLKYAYVGNVPGHPDGDTYCPKCGKAVIKRDLFAVKEKHLAGGKCGFCGYRISGVWA